MRHGPGYSRLPEAGVPCYGSFDHGEPSDRSRPLLDKIGEYLDAGVRLVWVIDPARRVANCYRSLTDVRTVTAEQELDGEDVVPGFRCRLSDLLDEP
jgi:Uma2 family endonuclease